jgi:hypothetical protein
MKQIISLISNTIKLLASFIWYTTKAVLMAIWWACTSMLPFVIFFFEFARYFKSDAERMD